MKNFNLVNSVATGKHFAGFVTILFAVAAFTVSAFAQQESGQINGTVKDPNEAVIPSACVSRAGRLEFRFGFNQKLPRVRALRRSTSRRANQRFQYD